ncbi:hypothetical protein [Rhodococcus pyridinivorans]|uniref:Uncharacterized protein n=1 Tax=Rhodococcus pyridinivorans TaxID=103816 RepID=A0A7M2XJL5_9NOCA|nr:hypothetical protein [Rhodococcus pyridinivorans]QOV97180.1 hypothetical protein INP59_14480 [Rhodococcus pyridinivorans]
MIDPKTPEGRAELRELLAKATPEPWQVDDCEGELRIGAGDAVTKWEDRTTEDGRSYRIGTPPRSWKATDLIYEHDLDTWDEGEDQDDDQRRTDAELIVAAVNALPALLDALDQADDHAKFLESVADINDTHAGLWQARATKAEADLNRVRELSEEGKCWGGADAIEEFIRRLDEILDGPR